MPDLRLVHSRPDFFGINGDLAVRTGEGFGCTCAECGRAISAPFGYERKLIWCLYCGMGRGHVPLVEPVLGHRFAFGVTGEEAAEERRWLLECPDNFEARCEARARKQGRVLDMF